MNIYRTKRNPMVRFFFLLTLCLVAFSQSPQPTQTALQLDELLNVNSMPSGFTYYSVNFELKDADLKLFLITVETEQFDFIQIYTSMKYDGVTEYFEFPNDENNSNSCSYASLDTCAIALPEIKQGETKNVTVYIGVQLLLSDQMSILATVEDIYPFKVGINYDIDFAVWESAVFTLSADEVNLYEQLVVQMQYDSFQDAGKFALFAGVDHIPNNDTNRIEGKFMGAFTQILILQPLPNNSTYYIVLEGQLGTEFDVVIKPFSKSAPKLVMNDTVFYYSSGPMQKDEDKMNFSIAIDYSSEQEILPLLIDLNSLGGYGSFEIDYCDQLTNFTFQNFDGESGQIIIPVEERKECYAKIFAQGSLMIENIIISINASWYFSFSIGILQGEHALMMSPYSQKMGTLVASEDLRVYEMEGYVNESFVLKFKTISGEESLNFTLLECKSRWLLDDKCKEILNSNDDGIVDPLSPQYKQFNYTCAQKRYYKLQVSHGSVPQKDSEYVLLLLPLNPGAINLSPSRPIFSIISQNQYQYYVINLSLIEKQSNLSISNSTDVLITMVQTNGNCLLLTSLKEQYPKYDQVFENDSTVDYSWNGKAQYTVNADSVIYVGIMGAKESLYHLQVSIEVNEDAPQSYIKLVSDKSLTYTLTAEKQDHILLSYKSHSIPYTVIISPSAPCVAYSYQLPFSNTSCRQLPSQITQKTIYFKVFRKSPNQTQDDNDFKFMVYVYTGLHYLFEYSPVLIACQDTCYEYVTVYVREKIKIVHKGMGYIGRKDSEEEFSNEKMEITCETNYPCSLTINASLPYGGQMELFYDSINIQQIEWTTKPLTFQTLTEHKLFYMEIRSWNNLNTAIFYTEGLSLTIYYNIYSMRENATNALQYGFPNSFSWMRKNVGNPLRRFHVVEFDKALIESLGCKDENDVCIATLTVYPNSYALSTPEYVNKSIGYFSCNTYEYYTPMNAPYQLSEEYSLVYFEHQLTDDEKASISPFYYVKVEPLSSCRPQIFAPFTPSVVQNTSYDKDMPFYGTYKIDSAILDKENPEIEFIISTDTPCEYTLWLLDSDIQPVSENANYELLSNQNGMILFVFSDRFLWKDKKFTVVFDETMSEIVIGKYQKSADGSIIQPTINSSLAYITQSRRLQFTSPEVQSTLYIIRAVTSANNKVNVKISTYQGDTVIMTNEKQKFIFDQNNSTVTYRYFSNSDFLMFITNDWGSVKLTITDFRRGEDRNVVDQMISEDSSPWVKVNAIKGDIREYIITLENLLLSNGESRNLQQSDTKYPKVTFHIEETGTIGLPQLYDGVALFDAFYNEDAQNCYKYVTEQIVGRHTLNVDLIFGSEFINNVPTIRQRVSIEDGDKINSTWTKIPTGYRLSTEFYGNDIYQFCFSINEQPSLVSKQFYVIVEDIDCQLKHLTLDVPSSSNVAGAYEIYQYVATENQTVMIEVVNCFGKPTLLGAKKYPDIYLGQVSQLGSFYRDETMSIAKKNLQLGYFFFGIKLDNLQDRYKIRVQLLGQNQTLHYDRFELKQKTITKARTVQQNGREKVRVSLPSISTLNLSQQVKVHHITYNLLVDNLKEYQQYSSNVIAKCPVLANRNLSSYIFVQNLSSSIKTNSPSSQQITIDIPISEVPESFNLTGYVEIAINEPYAQTLTYYYDSTTFRLRNTRNNAGISGVGAFFVVMLVIGSLVVIYIIYKRWKKHRRESRVAFEMTNFNHEQNNTTNVTEQKETEVTVPASPTPVRPLKKALNQNVGYGEFIDESM